MTPAAAQRTLRNNNSAAISTGILLRILRFEDERRWDDDLRILLAAKDAKVRKRTALAMGRIGDERALPALVDALKDKVTIAAPLERKFYGVTEFGVNDPDGYLVTFGERLD